MPNTYIKFTDTELERANSIDLATFLENRGETLKRIGRDHKLIYTDETGSHDSITIRGNKWYDHKNHEGGGTIKFIQQHYNLYFHEAVQELIGNSAGTDYISHTTEPHRQLNADISGTYMSAESEAEALRKEFILPSANSNMRRVFAYLTKARHLDPEVLSHFAHERKIYEDSEFHNVVFVGYDENGEAKQAHKRSTLSFGGSASAFRQTIEGSDTRYSFNHIGKNNRIYAFEAPIDMLSFISLYKQNWQDNTYITLNGTYEHALTHILEVNPDINEIYICTDNDEGGIDAYDRLKDILGEKGYGRVFRIAPEYNDWNECLKAQYGIEAQPAVLHRRKELYHGAVNNLKPASLNLDKLSKYLWSLYKQGQYQKLAEATLSACEMFSKNINPDRDCFSDLKRCFIRDYRAYKDRGKLIGKAAELKKAMQNVMQDLKSNTTRTASQLRETARLLYFTANCALKCAVETEITATPEHIPQAREPTSDIILSPAQAL